MDDLKLIKIFNTLKSLSYLIISLIEMKFNTLLTGVNMKRTVLFFTVISIILLSSCTSNLPVSPNNGNQQGGISLNIDRAHKPANVVSVTAYLTRADYDSLSGTLNLLSDTTADITFNDIAAGGWHLKVDAADENDVVVYTGESDVQILAGITTQFNLTLVPTGNGTGNIHITVNWGVPPNTDWTDYEKIQYYRKYGTYNDYSWSWQGFVLRR